MLETCPKHSIQTILLIENCHQINIRVPGTGKKPLVTGSGNLGIGISCLGVGVFALVRYFWAVSPELGITPGTHTYGIVQLLRGQRGAVFRTVGAEYLAAFPENDKTDVYCQGQRFSNLKQISVTIEPAMMSPPSQPELGSAAGTPRHCVVGNPKSLTFS